MTENKKRNKINPGLVSLIMLIGILAITYLTLSHKFTKTDGPLGHCIKAVRQSTTLSEFEKRKEIHRIQAAERCIADGWSDCWKEVCVY